jgi:hypothetical protein
MRTDLRSHRVRRMLAGGVVLPLLSLLVACTGSADPPDGTSDSASGGPVTEDWEALYRAELEQLVENYKRMGLMDSPPTDVDLVRFIRPEEYGRVHAACIQEQGFSATETFDGGVEFGEIPPEQARAQAEAVYRCDVQFPVHPAYLQPWSDSQIRTLYDYYVEELTPCLTAAGYPVDPPPTWETFRDTYDTDSQWVPYRAVTVTDYGPEEWQEINEQCPQGPPLEHLFPDAP